MSRYLKDVEGSYTQEDNLWVLAIYERNRYFAGEKDALQNLKEILLDKRINDYYVLCAVISVMEEMMDVFNKDEMREILKDFLDLVPVGIKICEEDYPFQRITHFKGLSICLKTRMKLCWIW